jgi:EAL domain-containing protein (putative c-di-GMP-specific phosphodiesterase class I)
MRVVAEGVETADQVTRLKQVGCDLVQGYYFSRPLSPEAFRQYLLAPDERLLRVG